MDALHPGALAVKPPTKAQRLEMGGSLEKHLLHAMLLHVREQIGFADVIEVFEWKDEPGFPRVALFCTYLTADGIEGGKVHFWSGTMETLLRHLIAREC